MKYLQKDGGKYLQRDGYLAAIGGVIGSIPNLPTVLPIEADHYVGVLIIFLLWPYLLHRRISSLNIKPKWFFAILAVSVVLLYSGLALWVRALCFFILNTPLLVLEANKASKDKPESADSDATE